MNKLVIIAGIAIAGGASYWISSQGSNPLSKTAEETPKTIQAPVKNPFAAAPSEIPETPQNEKGDAAFTPTKDALRPDFKVIKKAAYEQKTRVETPELPYEIVEIMEPKGPYQRFMVAAVGEEMDPFMLLHNEEVNGGIPARVGDTLQIKATYDWTAKGGVLHQTGRSVIPDLKNGYIVFNGQKYQ